MASLDQSKRNTDLEKGGLKAWPALLAGAHAVFLLEKEDMGYYCCCVQARFLGKGTQITFPC